MSKLSLSVRLSLCGALCVGVFACSSPPPAGTPVSENVHNIDGNNVYRWWDNPGDLGDNLVAVGVSPRTPNLAMSRTAATVNGRAELAAILNAKIQSLTELWAQDTGDLANPESMQSLMNNESFTRQIVDSNIRGARAKMFKEENGSYFALVVLEDPNSFLDAVAAQVDEQVIQDETYFKTEVRKEDARNRMDTLLEKEKMKVSEARGDFQGGDL